MSDSKKYILNVDIIRVLALFAVVGIHLLTPIYARPDFFGGKFWWVSFLLNGLFRVSVPLFIMLSGYLLLDKDTDIYKNLERTKSRILIPLLSFYIIGYVYNMLAALRRHSPFDYLSFFHNLSKDTYSYLYFLVILLFLYFLVPFFQTIVRSKDKSLLNYVVVFFFANALVATLARYLSLRVGDVFNTYTFWILWVGYFLMGYWIRVYQSQFSKLRLQFLFILIGNFAATIVLGYFSLQQHWRGNDIFYIGGETYPDEYLSVGVTMMSIAAFILLITTRVSTKIAGNERFKKWLKWLAEISFGVYLVHPLVMDFLNKFCGVTADSPLMPNLVVYVIVNALLTLSVSIALSAALNKIPVVRRIVGRTS